MDNGKKFGTAFGNRISQLCYDHYNRLPKTGRPQDTEGTMLAAVVLQINSDFDTVHLKVVSMGTGTKCLGMSKMTTSGDIVNDSHAEIIARRAFLLYLYEKLKSAYQNSSNEIFNLPSMQSDYRCSLKSGITFHFFTSQTPCGDASIFPMNLKVPGILFGEDDTDDKECSCKKRGTDFGYVAAEEKRFRLDHCPSLFPSSDTCETDRYQLVSNCQTASNDTVDSAARDNSMVSSVFSSDRNSDQIHVGSRSLNSDLASRHSVSCIPGHGTASTGEPVAFHCGVDDGTASGTGPASHDGFRRTGAKCVPDGVQDPLGAGAGYNTVGAFRSKPGRGERTMSMSCSDKMARWNVLGCQGSLLTHFLIRPMLFESVVVGLCPFNRAAMQRALVGRLFSPQQAITSAVCDIHHPAIIQSSLPFGDIIRPIERRQGGRCENGARPSACSKVWYDSADGGVHEVIVNGRRQGVTRQNALKAEARSCISNVNILRRFKELLQGIPLDKRPKSLRMIGSCIDHVTYLELKMAAIEYQEAWKQLLQSTFRTWLRKPIHKYYAFV